MQTSHLGSLPLRLPSIKKSEDNRCRIGGVKPSCFPSKMYCCTKNAVSGRLIRGKSLWNNRLEVSVDKTLTFDNVTVAHKKSRITRKWDIGSLLRRRRIRSPLSTRLFRWWLSHQWSLLRESERRTRTQRHSSWRRKRQKTSFQIQGIGVRTALRKRWRWFSDGSEANWVSLIFGKQLYSIPPFALKTFDSFLVLVLRPKQTIRGLKV